MLNLQYVQKKDVFDADYVIFDDAFFSKFNAITSYFAYLFDVYSTGNVQTLDHIMSISHLNSIHTEPFNISDTESPKELQLAINLSFEEKSELERIIKNGKQSLLGAMMICQEQIMK